MSDNIKPVNVDHFSLALSLRHYFSPLFNDEVTIEFHTVYSVIVQGNNRKISLTLAEAQAIHQAYVDQTIHKKMYDWVHIDTFAELHAFYLTRLRPIRIVAQACGYAIGSHGSMQRDLDLIAVPWVDNPNSVDVLVRAIHRAACGLESESYYWERKPLGRIATSFPICWTNINMGCTIPNLGHIDLSVMGMEKGQ